MTTFVADDWTTELLGTRIPAHEPLTVLKALEAGLPSRTLTRFKKAAGLSDPDVVGLLRIGGRTLTRIKASGAGRLPSDLSERLYAVAESYARATEVFGARAAALGWLAEPNSALGNRVPRELLGSELGRQQVRALLERIEFGNLA
jgi:putative toxin-antitoxin system antitoxin component (TIGR02293 family)